MSDKITEQQYRKRLRYLWSLRATNPEVADRLAKRWDMEDYLDRQ